MTTLAIPRCKRCHQTFIPYWDSHRREDDLESIERAGKCMRCAIKNKVPSNWNPDELGAQGRNDWKIKQQKEGKQHDRKYL